MHMHNALIIGNQSIVCVCVCVCVHFKVDFDEWAVCGRFVVKPHVEPALDESKKLV